MGAPRYPSPPRNAIDGYRFAPPILRASIQMDQTPVQTPDSIFKEPETIRCRPVIASEAKQSMAATQIKIDCFAALPMTGPNYRGQHVFPSPVTSASTDHSA